MVSGIAGIFTLNAQPAPQAPFKAVMSRLAHRGPDGSGVWQDRELALGFQSMHTTPEAVRETQPLVRGTDAIVFHGRLDNIESLRADLAAPAAGDAELALLACQRWGDEAPARFLGDFAFAYWDGARRRLLCARDWCGARPFAYAQHHGRLVFASEPGALFGDPDLPRVPNEGMIGEFLADAVTHRSETLWQGVLRLPPSHLLIADATGVRTRAYKPLPTTNSRLRTDLSHAQRFREIFTASVTARLRSQSKIAVDLSGGLDSSSIAGMAKSLGAEFETFSEVFPGLACDERPYIEEVVRKWGLTSHLIPGSAASPSLYEQTAAATLDHPGYPNSSVAMPARRTAAAAGFRVVLMGAGADEWLTGARPRPHGLLRPALRALLPGALYEGLARVMGKRRGPAWIPPAFAKRISLADRLRARDILRSPLPGPTAARRFARAFTAWEQHLLETDERDTARLGLEIRWPFLDRRVIEFALAVPADQLRRGTTTKFVMREALRDVLPEAVRTRTTKADFSHLFADTFRAMGGEYAFRSLGIAEKGWVDGEGAAALFLGLMEDEKEGNLERSRRMWPAWMILSLEIWYRSSVRIGTHKGAPPETERT